ncbi:type II toxin-antitoxin system antitoxin, RelB/DinJ family [Gluconobacter sp. LMG 1744]|uniref:type II toxin-antitoxin system RelB/DinJ family antitoxin n=1 Tax=Gluconobacter cadivus TaxID=2728101 RepID=UPI001884BD3E|nr:type II toxin-antitoxin system RelB/DinJ family antitoxin [Gluconobacter cadivus]MBF0892752.1 type II toxin-antitoxin system antitoxin, RelB/DinJ family [Gluconobacter cadivus]
MATTHFGVRLDADFKEEAFAKVKELGTTPTDLFKDVLSYVLKNNRLPVSTEVLSDEDAQLIKLARERLAEPNKFKKVNLHDLLDSISREGTRGV